MSLATFIVGLLTWTLTTSRSTLTVVVADPRALTSTYGDSRLRIAQSCTALDPAKPWQIHIDSFNTGDMWALPYFATANEAAHYLTRLIADGEWRRTIRELEAREEHWEACQP